LNPPLSLLARDAAGGVGGVEIRYGIETVVPSPVAEMLKVPAALLGAYE
jgi:hypothetical protein